MWYKHKAYVPTEPQSHGFSTLPMGYMYENKIVVILKCEQYVLWELAVDDGTASSAHPSDWDLTCTALLLIWYISVLAYSFSYLYQFDMI